ncbi:hypothetical protein ACWC5C_03785 [Streptomyces sp. NPDC001700]
MFEITVAIAAGKAAGFTNRQWTIATLVSGAIATYFRQRLNWRKALGIAVVIAGVVGLQLSGGA